MALFDRNIFDSNVFDTRGVPVAPANDDDEYWGEGAIRPRARKGIKLNQYKQFKFIDRSGNTYYRKPQENGY